MKKPWLAFLLNFILPGAGLAYLGKWGWALLNFVAVLILGFLLASAVPSDSLGAVSAGLGAASGALAMSLAGGMNAKANARASGVPAPALYGISPVLGTGGGPPNAAPPAVSAQPASPRAKFCGKCGAPASSAKFCGECGSPIRPANQ